MLPMTTSSSSKCCPKCWDITALNQEWEKIEDLLHLVGEPIYLPEDFQKLDGRASRWRNAMREEIQTLITSLLTRAREGERTRIIELVEGIKDTRTNVDDDEWNKRNIGFNAALSKIRTLINSSRDV